MTACGEPNFDFRFQRDFSHILDRDRSLSFRLVTMIPEEGKPSLQSAEIDQ